jgi:hypothetical protein
VSTPSRIAGLVVLLLGASTCSTLDEQPAPRQCELSSDCADAEVCKSGRCEDASKDPPLAHLAFDIEERAGQEVFRAQVWGCDREVVDAMEGREIRIARGEVAQRFELQVHAREGVDVDNPQPDDLLPSDLVLTQGGRFGRLPVTRDGIEHPPVAEETLAVSSSIVPWPRYHLFDAMQPPAHIVWETRPDGRGSVLRMFRPPETAGPRECMVDTDCCNGDGCDPSPNECDVEAGLCTIGCRNDLDCCVGSGCEPTPPNFCVEGVQECTLIGNPSFLYAYLYDTACDRAAEGDVLLFDPGGGTAPLVGASVRLRHLDPPGNGPFGVFDSSVGDPGTAEAECDPALEGSCGSADLVCDPETAQCMLSLVGRDAGTATTSEGTPTSPPGHFETPVYTYCEREYAEALQAGDGTPSLERGFSVQITPSPETPHPTVSYEVSEATVSPTGGPISLGQRFCVPDWGPPTVLALALEGEPRQLVPDTAAFRCCDVGCLPATMDAVDPAQMNATSCTGSTSAGVQPSVTLVSELRLDADERAAWEEADCMLPVDGVIGRLSRKADCSGTETCVVQALAAGDADSPRVYDVRVESPVGSVLGSADFVIEIGPDATPAVMPTLALPPRVLVRGQVDVDEAVCTRRDDAEDDCASRGAVVLAERLAIGDDTSANVPGPYLHQVSTFHDPIAGRDGAFVLPLDPGVWVLTALPTGDNDGGPAGFTVLDLRDGMAPDPLHLVLGEGILVTLNLRTFDRRSTVAPVDLGSWEGLALPGDPAITFDLNATTTCLTPAGDPLQGCRIRQLVPPGSSLTLTQVGLAFFTARQPANAASATCSGGG